MLGENCDMGLSGCGSCCLGLKHCSPHLAKPKPFDKAQQESVTPGLELGCGRAVTAAVLAVLSALSALGTCRSWSFRLLKCGRNRAEPAARVECHILM